MPAVCHARYDSGRHPPPRPARPSSGRRHASVLGWERRKLTPGVAASKAMVFGDPNKHVGGPPQPARPKTPPLPADELAAQLRSSRSARSKQINILELANQAASKQQGWLMLKKQFKSTTAKTAAVHALKDAPAGRGSGRPPLWKTWQEEGGGPMLSAREVQAANRRKNELAVARTSQFHFGRAPGGKKTQAWIAEVQAAAASGGLFDIRHFRPPGGAAAAGGGGQVSPGGGEHHGSRFRGGSGLDQPSEFSPSPPSSPKPVAVAGDYNLNSAEHTSVALRRRLQKGDTLDTRVLAEATPKLGSHSVLYDSIVNLLTLATSAYPEIRRDAAAALNSLSIGNDNKPTFAKAGALPTLVLLAQCRDHETLTHTSEAIYRLSMHLDLKQPLVDAGILEALYDLSRSVIG
eukprot:SAG22_NODE_176_length_16162_cov_30.625910_6_plen_406_part_00